MWMKPWSNSTRVGHAAIPDSRPYIRIGRGDEGDMSSEFRRTLGLAEVQHREATAAFREAGGERMRGLSLA